MTFEPGQHFAAFADDLREKYSVATRKRLIELLAEGGAADGRRNRIEIEQAGREPCAPATARPHTIRLTDVKQARQ
jgi:hypothetical protein